MTRKLEDEEIELLRKAIPLLMDIKTQNFEDAVMSCEKVGSNYREFKKMKKSLKKVYQDYKDLLGGLGYLAINNEPFERKVNSLLRKYQNTRLYFEIENGDSNKEERGYEFRKQ